MDGYFISRLFVRGGAEQYRHDAPIVFGESIFFKGCNIYHTQPVLCQRVFFRRAVREDQDLVSPAFKKAFVQRFLALPRFGPTHGERDAVEDRIIRNERLGLPEILLEAILAVETAVLFTAVDFHPIPFFIVEDRSAHVNLVWETTSPKLSRRAAEVALTGVLELLRDQIPVFGHSQMDFDASLQELLEAARQRRPTHTASLMAYVARQRGLPVKLLSREQLRVGHGRTQRLLEASMPDATSAVAHRCCWDKRLAIRRMAEFRLPVPRHVKARTIEAAREATEQVGFPVVVKPVKGSGGQGVTSNITTYADVEAAFLRAKRPEQDVLIEEYVPGFLHRLLFIGGRFAGAIQCRPPMIRGDGRKTVRELIDDLNADPRRNGMIMGPVVYDDEVERQLAQKGLSLESVMADGDTCMLRLVANIGMGSSSEDCTDRVHEDNRELAERAAKCLFLDVGGIDFITPDISRSFRDVGGRIIEVNTRPGLLTHMWPAYGQPRNFAAQILERIYPPGEDGRIPVVVVTGDRGTGTAAHLLDHLLRGCGKSTGLWLPKAAYIKGKLCELKRKGKQLAPAALLSDPHVEMLVSAISLRRVVQRGLQLESCSVAVILDRNNEENTEQFRTGIPVIERATAEAFVVGIGNRTALQHLQALGKRTLILVGDRITDPAAQQHLARGGTMIADRRSIKGGGIVLMTGRRLIAEFPAPEPSGALPKGQQRRMRQVIRYAVAAAFAAGIPIAEIKAAIENIQAA